MEDLNKIDFEECCANDLADYIDNLYEVLKDEDMNIYEKTAIEQNIPRLTNLYIKKTEK